MTTNIKRGLVDFSFRSVKSVGNQLKTIYGHINDKKFRKVYHTNLHVSYSMPQKCIVDTRFHDTIYICSCSSYQYHAIISHLTQQRHSIIYSTQTQRVNTGKPENMVKDLIPLYPVECPIKFSSVLYTPLDTWIHWKHWAGIIQLNSITSDTWYKAAWKLQFSDYLGQSYIRDFVKNPWFEK